MIHHVVPSKCSVKVRPMSVLGSVNVPTAQMSLAEVAAMPLNESRQPKTCGINRGYRDP
jgi:hypothetical protein